MNEVSALNARLRALVGPRARTWLVGVENEFHLLADGRSVDFRTLLRRLARLEAVPPLFTYSNVCHLRSGAQLSADRSCAEMATPPMPMDREGLADLAAAVVANRNHLHALLAEHARRAGGAWRIEGYSTHFNFQHPDPMPWAMCRLLQRTVLPAWILLVERSVSGGVMLRPRPCRVEFGADHVACPEDLRAALLYLAATYRALARRRAEGRLSEVPLWLHADAVHWPRTRTGYAYSRRSFGGQLHRRGREAVVGAYSVRRGTFSVRAQEVLETYHDFAREELEALGSEQDRALLDDRIAGRAPLSIERKRPQAAYYDVSPTPTTWEPRGLARVFADAVVRRELGGLTVDAEDVSWRGIGYSLWNGHGAVTAFVQRGDLLAFEDALRDGQLRPLVDECVARARRAAAETDAAIVPNTLAEEGTPPSPVRTGFRQVLLPARTGAEGEDAPAAAAPKKKPPRKKPPKKKKGKKKDRCPAPCTVKVVDRRPGRRRVKIYLPITSDPLVPPADRAPPISAAIGAHNVMLQDGSFFEVAQDLRTDSVGMPFSFMRIHRTNTTYDGVMGQRWDHTYNKRIVPSGRVLVCKKKKPPVVVLFEEFDEADRSKRGGPIDYLKGDCTRETHGFVTWEWRTVRFCGADDFEAVVTTYARNPGERFRLQRYAVVGGRSPYGVEPIFYLARHHDGTRYVFNCHGHLIQIADRNANKMAFFYGAPKNPTTNYDVLTQIVDTAGRVHTLQYEKVNGTPRVKRLTDARATPRTVTFTYNGRAELELVRTPDGMFVSRRFFPATVPPPLQVNVRRYEYDAASRLVRVFNPRELARRADAALENRFDAQGRVEWQRRGGGGLPAAPPAGGTFGFTYDADGVSKIVDRRGTEHHYRLRTIAGRKVIRELRVTNRPVSWVGVRVVGEPAEFALSIDHDAEYQPTEVRHPGGLIEQFKYEPASAPVTVGDEREWVERGVTFEDNLARGNVRRCTLISPKPTDPSKVRTWDYEPLFNASEREVDETGSVKEMKYTHGLCATPQDNGNPYQVIWPKRSLPDGTLVPMVERFTYKEGGLTEQHTDCAGVVTRAEYTAEGYLVKSTFDFGGKNLTTRYKHDERGNLLEVTNARGYTTTREYDDRDRVLAVYDPKGTPTEQVHDENDRVVVTRQHVVDHGPPPAGVAAQPARVVETRFVFDVLDQIVERYDDATGIAARTSYRYDPNGNLVLTTLPNGNAGDPRNAIETVFDVRDLPVIETRCPAGTTGAADPPPSVRQTLYDVTGHPFAEVDPMRRVTRLETDGYGFITKITDHAGHVVVRTPTADGLLESVEAYGPPSGPTPTDAAGGRNRLLSYMELAHDEYRNVIRRTVYSFDREDPSSRPVLPLVTEYWNNSLHQLVVQSNPDGSVVTILHDTAGRAAFQIDSSGGVLELVRDANGNIDHEIVTNVPDADRLVDPQAARRVVTSHVHDELDRVVVTMNQLNGFARFGYDSRSRSRWTVSPAGAVSEYRHDGLGRLTDTLKHGAASPSGVVHLTQGYDKSGNVVTRTDGASRVTEFKHDCHDRVHTVLDPDGRETRRLFFPDGRLEWLRKRDGAWLRHDYDRLGRLRGRTFTNPGTYPGTLTQSFEYDGTGAITRAKDDNGAGADTDVVRQYDSLGRMVEDRQDGRSVAFEFGAERFPLELVYPDGTRVSWRGDAAGREKAVSLGGVELARYAYDSLTRLAERQVYSRVRGQPPGNPPAVFAFPIVRRTIYDSVNRHHAANEVITRPNDPAFRHTLVDMGVISYDRDGYVRDVVDSRRWKTITSDGLGRAATDVTRDQTGANPVLSRTSWTIFDDAGNADVTHIQEQRRAGGDATTFILPGYNALNQLESRMVVTQQGGTSSHRNETFDYHDQGHLFSSRVTLPGRPGEAAVQGVRFLTYDVLDRLVEAIFVPDSQRFANKLLFEYDALGRRAKTIKFNISPPAVETFVAHVRHVYADERVVMELRSTLGPDRAGIPVRRYYWGPGGAELLALDAFELYVEGGPADLDADGQTVEWTGFHYHADHQGNLVALTRREFATPAGVMPSIPGFPQERFDYEGAGVLVLELDPTTGAPTPRLDSRTGQPFYFHGSRFDRPVYLQSFGQRAFDPDIGRFTTRDPLGSWADPLSLGNGYIFANNNPENFTDSSGLAVETVWDVASFGLGVYSISRWDETTPWYDKALDVLGVVVDAAAIALPFIPGGVGAGLKAYRAARSVEGAIDVFRKADRLEDVVQLLRTGKKVERALNAVQGVNMGLNAVRSYDRYQESGSLWDAGAALLGVGGAARSLTAALRGVCFPAGTLVLTEAGLRPIDEVELGERVRAHDDDEGPVWARVVDRQRRSEDSLRVLLLRRDADEEPTQVVTTDDHPIWCFEANGWLAAGRLEPGMRVALLDGFATVDGSVREVLAEPVEVFNLEVEGARCYYVGELLLLVHNTCTYEYIETALRNGKIDEIAQIFQKTTNEALGILADPARLAAEKVAWGKYFLKPDWQPETGRFSDPALKEVWRRIVLGNTLQQVVDKTLDWQKVESVAKSVLIRNQGFVRRTPQSALLRPDWRIKVDGLITVLDLSTEALKGKITKYRPTGGGGADVLVALSYVAEHLVKA